LWNNANMKQIVLALLLVGLAERAPLAAQQTGAQREALGGPTTAQPFDPIAEAYNQFLVAQRLEEDNDVTGAIAAYKRAMTLDPKSADIVAELANLYLRQSRRSEAMATAEQALKINPDNLEAHRVLGSVYAMMVSQGEADKSARDASRDQVAKAIQHLEASLSPATASSDANTRAMLSRLYISVADFDKAIAMLTDLVKQEPSWQDGASLLVQAYAAAGRSAEAVAFLEQSAPDNPRLYSTLAEFYGRQNRWQEATDAYALALQRSPRNFDLRVGYGSALLNLGGKANAVKARDALRDALSGRSTDQRALYLLSQAERRSGELDAAEATARRLIGLNSSGPRGFLALAEALEDRQRYQAVVDALAPAVAEFRSSSTAAIALPALLPHLGFAYQQLGRSQNAVEVFQEALKLSPDDATIAGELAQAQIGVKNYVAAVSTIQAARTKSPDDLRLARLEAQALHHSGKTDQGIAVLQNLLQRHANDPAAHIALAQGYMFANRGPQAIQVLRDAQAKFPDESRIVFELGSTFDKQKRFADAEAAFRQLIAKEPENALALNYLGYILADRGERLDESVSLLLRALKIEPENGSYLDSLGWAYYKGGKLDLAEEHLKRAAELMTINSVIQDHYGDLLFKMGRVDDAIAAWTRALAGDGDSINPEDIDRKIKSARQKLPRK
jgi:tetratricopeptide (TPR) repeat protein